MNLKLWTAQGPARTMNLAVVSLTPSRIQAKVHREEGCPLDGLFRVHCGPSLLGAHLVPLIMAVCESVCTYAINLIAPGSTGFSMLAQYSYALEKGLQHMVSPLYRNKVSVSPSQKYWAHWYRPYFFSLLLRESCGTVSKAFLKQNMSHLLPPLHLVDIIFSKKEIRVRSHDLFLVNLCLFFFSLFSIFYLL